MSTPHEAPRLHHEAILQLIEDYTTTIHALQSFISFATWDKSAAKPLATSKSSLGRRMDTSPDNSISPNSVVTPDAVIQRDEGLGYVVEAKKSLPRNQDYWRAIVTQLQKYDDELAGWWNEGEMIHTCCIVLLIEISRAGAFSRYWASLEEGEGLNFNNPVSIVEFTRSPEVRQFIFIRKNRGDIEPDDLSRRLEDGCKVPSEDVIASYGEKKFYDSEPVTEHTMEILWQVLFNEMKSEKDYDEQDRAWLLPVNLNDLTEDLQRLYGSTGSEPRRVAFPRVQWVRNAMDAFVSLELAQKVDDSQYYVVYFKKIRGDVLERFVKHREAKPGKRRETYAEQLSFLADDSVD